MDVRFRPIDQWPGALTPEGRRERAKFTASWSDTLDVLDRELRHLRARQIVIQLALDESQIRLDGWPRSDARPTHPGVILAFDSEWGPLKYATDRFEGGGWRGYGKDRLPGWQCNLRAVALGLEALRKVDRYGITKRGEQYTGWRALPSGIAAPASLLTSEEAAQLIYPEDPDWLLDVGDVDDVRREYRFRAKAAHPDQGGDPDEFRRLTEARDLLLKRFS